MNNRECNKAERSGSKNLNKKQKNMTNYNQI